jgi:predicted nucleotidyltransferase
MLWEDMLVQSPSDLPVSASERDAIHEAVKILSDCLPVDRIVLFGSKARGEDDDESDIDLLVLTRRTTTRGERHAACDAVHPVQLQRGVVISLLIVSTEDWTSGPFSVLPIHKEVEDQGVPVAA